MVRLARVPLALSFLAAGLLAGAAAGAASGGSAPRRPPSTPGGSPLPVEENLSERRAVRGSAVDDPSVAPESPELREVRRFEERAFPRNAPLDAAAAAPVGGG